MICPECILTNPPRAVICDDCGYNFVTKQRKHEWKPEPELACDCPRRVRLTLEAAGEYAFFSVVAVGVTFGFLHSKNITAFQAVLICGAFSALSIAILATIETRRRLSKTIVEWGTPVRGTVVSVEHNWRWRFNGVGISGRRDTKIILAYETAEGPMVHELNEEVKATWKGSKAGDTYTLLYLPESPEAPMLYHQCMYRARKGR